MPDHETVQAPSAAAPPAILLVDDDEGKRLAIRTILAPLGHAVVEADSGRAALRAVLRQTFALILMDVRMPTLDGYETAKLIRQRRQTRLTPIVFITAFVEEYPMATATAYASGAVDFIFTPVHPDVLRIKVSTYVDLFVQSQELQRSLESITVLNAALRNSEARAQAVLANVADGIVTADERGQIESFNRSARQLFGYTEEEVIGQPLALIIASSDHDDLSDPARATPSLLTTNDTPAEPTEMVGRRKDGSCFPMEMETSEMQIGERTLTIGCIRDISERKAYTEALGHQALHDPLTGLPNRRMLSAHLAQAIAQARTERTELVLMLVDLDRFKELNDTLGYPAGDQLLREIAPRLIERSSGAALIARFGGDEFAVILPPGTSAADAERIAEQLRDALKEPFDFHGLTLRIGAHVGIAIYPEHAQDAETLTRRADIAMYSAKKHRVGHEIYDAAHDEHNRERLTLIGELPAAIASGELVMHYQLKYDLHDATITGVEALVRWQHPERGLLAPGSFLALAEQTGLMRPLTHAVLNGALSQCSRWRAQNIELRVAVNLAGPNLLDNALAPDVQALLDKWGLPASSLQLEITEAIVANDPASIADVLGQLRALGVTLSLDHFGIGSSSLSFLRRLPIQELKIDRSFILEMNTNDDNAAVVHTIIDLAHDLGMWTVAEGIETNAVSDRLASFGCDQGQGFLLGRPVPAHQLTALTGNLAADNKHD